MSRFMATGGDLDHYPTGKLARAGRSPKHPVIMAEIVAVRPCPHRDEFPCPQQAHHKWTGTDCSAIHTEYIPRSSQSVVRSLQLVHGRL